MIDLVSMPSLLNAANFRQANPPDGGQRGCANFGKREGNDLRSSRASRPAAGRRQHDKRKALAVVLQPLADHTGLGDCASECIA